MPFLTFPVLVWLIDGSAAGRLGGVPAAASAGWWFGFGYFLAGLYWVGHAFLVDAKTFGWLLPFAVIALPAGLALFTAFGAALARLSVDARRDAHGRARGGAHASPNGCAAICSPDFPGTRSAMRWRRRWRWRRPPSLIGIWGLTFIAVAVYAAPAVLADDPADTRRPLARARARASS